jgi:hypothetical protein
MSSTLHWLFVEHFKDYDKWPWARVNSLEKQLAEHPTFVLMELTAYALVALSFYHAWSESAKPGGSSRRLKLTWVATFVIGILNDYIFMLLPIVDNFWQAQAVIMLTPRMPLYIPCVYNVMLYWPAVGAARVFYHGNRCQLAEAGLGGLLCCIIYAPYDMCGARFLWWTWHDSDPGVLLKWLGVPGGSTAWTLSFCFCFCYLLRQGSDWGWSERKTLALAGLTTPMMMLILNVFTCIAYFFSPDKIGMPGPTTAFMTAIVFAGFVMRREKDPCTSVPSDCIGNESWVVRGGIIPYYVMLVCVMTFFSPENQISTGAHQVFGACDATDVDLLGYPRNRYICEERYPKFYFRFDCPANKEVVMVKDDLVIRPVGTGRWERLTPMAAKRNSGTDEASWYTVCGREHADWPRWMAGLIMLTTAGSAMFLWAFGVNEHRAIVQREAPSYGATWEKIALATSAERLPLTAAVALLDAVCMSVLVFAADPSSAAAMTLSIVIVVLCKLTLLLLFLFCW